MRTEVHRDMSQRTMAFPTDRLTDIDARTSQCGKFFYGVCVGSCDDMRLMISCRVRIRTNRCDDSGLRVGESRIRPPVQGGDVPCEGIWCQRLVV